MTDQRTAELVAQLTDGTLSRRQFVRRAAALGMSATAIAALAGSAAVVRPSVVAARTQIDAKTLVIADNLAGAPWITLDPAVIYEINSQAAMNVVYETLYHLPDSTKPTEFQPLLAQAMPEFSPDGKVATIKLRPGVKFHHTGNEMTADDWIFSWNRLKNLKANPSFLAEYLGTYEAVDPLTIKLTLPGPNAALVAILSATPFSVSDSKEVKANGGSDAPDADQTDKAKDWLITNSAGTGPYRISEFDVNTEVIIDRHPEYWGEAPKLDRIIWRNEQDPNTQLQLVQTGEADIAYSLDPDAAGTVESDTNLQLLTGPTLNHNYLALHTQENPGGPLAKKELRQAVGYAIDYDGIINGLSGGASIKPATVIPLGLLGTEEVKDLGYKQDVAKAQQLFDAAGVGPVELTLTYNAGGSTDTGVSLDTLTAKLQSDLQRIDGLTVKLAPVPAPDRLQQYREGKLQFTWSGWSPDYPDVHTYAEPFGKTGGAAAKRVGYTNPRVDELLAQGIAELDAEKRKQIYIEIQMILIDDAAFLVLEQAIDRKPASTNVQGVQPHSVYMIQLRYASESA